MSNGPAAAKRRHDPRCYSLRLLTGPDGSTSPFDARANHAIKRSQSSPASRGVCLKTLGTIGRLARLSDPTARLGSVPPGRSGIAAGKRAQSESHVEDRDSDSARAEALDQDQASKACWSAGPGAGRSVAHAGRSR